MEEILKFLFFFSNNKMRKNREILKLLIIILHNNEFSFTVKVEETKQPKQNLIWATDNALSIRVNSKIEVISVCNIADSQA